MNLKVKLPFTITGECPTSSTGSVIGVWRSASLNWSHFSANELPWLFSHFISPTLTLLRTLDSFCNSEHSRVYGQTTGLNNLDCKFSLRDCSVMVLSMTWQISDPYFHERLAILCCILVARHAIRLDMIVMHVAMIMLMTAKQRGLDDQGRLVTHIMARLYQVRRSNFTSIKINQSINQSICMLCMYQAFQICNKFLNGGTSFSNLVSPERKWYYRSVSSWNVFKFLPWWSNLWTIQGVCPNNSRPGLQGSIWSALPVGVCSKKSVWKFCHELEGITMFLKWKTSIDWLIDGLALTAWFLLSNCFQGKKSFEVRQFSKRFFGKSVIRMQKPSV